MTKVLRKIDRRNALYGTYKYQIKPGSMKNGRDARKWCRETWGTPRIWVEHSNGNGSCSMWSQNNPRWTEVKRPGYTMPFIYIRDDADATMFSLRWVG